MNNYQKIILLLSICFVFNSVTAQDHWEIIGNMPNPVADAEMVFYQTGMYIMGGYSEVSQSPVNYIQRFDPVLKTWGENTSLILPRRGLVSVAYSREIFCAGGVSSESNNKNSIEVWDFFSTKVIIANSEYFNRKHASGIVYAGDLYILGGNPEKITPNHNYPYIVKYDLSDNLTSVVENQTYVNRKLPEQQMIECLQDNIYIFGGVLNGVSQDIFKYNINSKLLTKLEVSLLEPRAAGQTVLFGDENIIFIIGGYNESQKALSSVEIFSINGDEYNIWSGPELNTARTNFMASHYMNTLFIMGGFDSQGKVISSIETLAPIYSGIEKNDELPTYAELKQNYPNPFNPSTQIEFFLNQTCKVTLDIYSVNGEHIKNLVSNNLNAGQHEVMWNAKDKNGKQVTSGIYIYSIRGNNFNISKKMILIR